MLKKQNKKIPVKESLKEEQVPKVRKSLPAVEELKPISYIKSVFRDREPAPLLMERGLLREVEDGATPECLIDVKQNLTGTMIDNLVHSLSSKPEQGGLNFL